MPSSPAKLRLCSPVATDKRRIDVLNAAVRLAFVQGLRRRAWTIEHAARECGCSPDAICNYVSGKRRIPGSALFAVLELGAANENARAA